MPDDFFRIRLVCTMLDFCGGYFDRGTAKKKLDFFLTFFQVRIGRVAQHMSVPNLEAVLHLDERDPTHGYRLHGSGQLCSDKTPMEVDHEF